MSDEQGKGIPEFPWDMPSSERQFYEGVALKPVEERTPTEHMCKRYVDMCCELIQTRDSLIERANRSEQALAALEARNRELEERYAFSENQGLCIGFDGECDGDLEGIEHEENCPARVKDVQLRPHLYNPPALKGAS